MDAEDGEIRALSREQAAMILRQRPAIVCHAPLTRQRLGIDSLETFDLLELFAFVHPGHFCVPTPAGLAQVLGLPEPESPEDAPMVMMEATLALLRDLSRDIWSETAPALEIADVMGQQGRGWRWTPFVFAALGAQYDPAKPPDPARAFKVWNHLPEWSEDAPPPPGHHHPVTGEEARARLAELLAQRGGHGGNADTPGETRAGQQDYATALTAAFAPPELSGKPRVVLAQAGTGIGKTLGYLAPASLWAEKNEAPVWLSTYTKNLQRQIGGELARLYPDPAVRDNHATVRKGRENYLCLLNLEDLSKAAPLARNPMQAVAAGLMVRWAAACHDGDLTGADFPGWLSGLLGRTLTMGLADRRGECVYAACPHYHKCYIEKAARRTPHADIVVANHALLMHLLATGRADEHPPTRIVFDEAHHLFDAADSAFAAHLTGRENYDMRRWILGLDSGGSGSAGARKSRARGLRRRIEDLLEGNGEMESCLHRIVHAARALPAEGWSKRITVASPAPAGPAETFLACVYAQIISRKSGPDTPYSLETPCHPAAAEVLSAAKELRAALTHLYKPMLSLASLMQKHIQEHSDTLSGDTRRRMDSISQSLERRGRHMIAAWADMLSHLLDGHEPAEYADWFALEKVDGNPVDLGYYRHWVDPMQPFSVELKRNTHGLVMTSASLRDDSGEDEADWQRAAERTGSVYLGAPDRVEDFPSPFHYADQTRVFVISDVRRDDPAQIAAAYETLFLASGGGALGLFTAIQRLKDVRARIAAPLDRKGINLYAQHVDDMDPGTLVDVFRADVHACLLGTDAIRDGVDVPGAALRLLVFDRVPWPRPSIVHKARRTAFGGRTYDEMLTRLKLKQAFGRLVRRADDRGVFVMLDPMLPSKLYGAFPPGVSIEKCALSDAAATIRSFFDKTS